MLPHLITSRVCHQQRARAWRGLVQDLGFAFVAIIHRAISLVFDRRGVHFTLDLLRVLSCVQVSFFICEHVCRKLVGVLKLLLDDESLEGLPCLLSAPVARHVGKSSPVATLVAQLTLAVLTFCSASDERIAQNVVGQGVLLYA